MKMKFLVAIFLAMALSLSPVADAQVTGTVNVTNPRNSAGNPAPLGYVCNSAHDLDLLKVTVREGDPGVPVGSYANAFTIDPGCTGSIDRVEIETNGADAIKCRNNAALNGHDLVIGGGYLLSTGFAPGAHADGIQCMGGDRIMFRNLLIDFSGAPGGGGFFPSLGGAGTGGPPEDIVCDNCHIIHGATSVRVDSNIRSGVMNSVVCSPIGQAEHAAMDYASATNSPGAIGVNRQPVVIDVGRNEDALDDGNIVVPSGDARCSTEPGGSEPPPVPACMDGADNDGDELVDFPADPGCENELDNDEFNEPPPPPYNPACAPTCDEQIADLEGRLADANAEISRLMDLIRRALAILDEAE